MFFLPDRILMTMEENDPNKQQHHTFGSSPAAERLKQEIDKGANYRSAVRILNKAQTHSNDLIYSTIPDKKYFAGLMRKDVIQHLDSCGSDQIVKSLCRNIFTAK